MSRVIPTTSRRALLGALTAAPVMVPVIASPWSEALASLHADYGDDPTAIIRTKEGRALSRRRYHVAEGFFPAEHERADWHGYLHRAGITAQLALSSHLLDMGFADDWCARHIGLRVAKSLDYANATGLGHDCPDMVRLAGVLTPYCRWSRVSLFGEPEPDDGGLTAPQVHAPLRALLDRVRDVTGHPRPRGQRR